jgi:hypothetical protein
MDSLWVDQNLDRVNGLFTKRMRSWGLFAPTHQFYESLASGEDRSLENSVDQISSHLQLRLPPSVTYEWGLKLSPQIAGQISLGGTRSHIQIPLFYAGRPDALGAILAHELTHEAIAQEQIKFASIEELEQMTDLSAIALGLGKLILNGTVIELWEEIGDTESLGYLEKDKRIYAYIRANAFHGITEQEAVSFLNPASQAAIEDFKKRIP